MEDEIQKNIGHNIKIHLDKIKEENVRFMFLGLIIDKENNLSGEIRYSWKVSLPDKLFFAEILKAEVKRGIEMDLEKKIKEKQL